MDKIESVLTKFYDSTFYKNTACKHYNFPGKYRTALNIISLNTKKRVNTMIHS